MATPGRIARINRASDLGQAGGKPSGGSRREPAPHDGFRAQQIQGFFDIPVDHLYASPVMFDYLKYNKNGI